LPALDYAHFCPGHGDAHDPKAVAQAAAYSTDRLREIRQRVLAATATPVTGAEVLQRVTTGLGLAMDNPTQYYLNHTAVLAALASLHRAGEATIQSEDNQLLWTKS